MMAGPFADPDVVKTIREEMGFDRPLWIQYLDNLWDLARGKFGRSYQSRRPILKDILEVFPKTVQLALAAEVTSALVGIWLGVIAATRRNGWADRLIMTIAALNLSFPLFWLALMLQIVFAVFLRLLPPSGYGAGFDQFVILPAITLALPSLGLLARITRAALIEVMEEDYIRTARAKGLRSVLVMRRHILPNALIPIVTTIGTDFVRLLGGIPIIEVIFAWPGIGKYAYDALVFRDLPALQASVIVLAVSVSLVNLVSGPSVCIYQSANSLRLTGAAFQQARLPLIGVGVIAVFVLLAAPRPLYRQRPHPDRNAPRAVRRDDHAAIPSKPAQSVWHRPAGEGYLRTRCLRPPHLTHSRHSGARAVDDCRHFAGADFRLLPQSRRRRHYAHHRYHARFSCNPAGDDSDRRARARSGDCLYSAGARGMARRGPPCQGTGPGNQRSRPTWKRPAALAPETGVSSSVTYCPTAWVRLSSHSRWGYPAPSCTRPA